MEYRVTFSSDVEFNIIVSADNLETAKKLAVRQIDNLVTHNRELKNYNTESKELRFTQPLFLSKVTPLCEEIMDTSNSHDRELVRQINLLWSKKPESFKHILMSLMMRDIVEMYEWNCFGDNHEINLDIPAFQKRVENDWKSFVECYLMRVADDGDLNLIIGFVEMTCPMK
jgi:hypothetical protein